MQLRYEIGQTPLTFSRAELLADLARNPHTQFLIIGGGVHGAACARLAARNGFSCVLAERGDYAGETSSRSSKMLHGGLRYLELFDFAQVAEGIRAREDLFRTAPHLCLPEPFLIPLPQGDRWFRWKLALGLTLYDQMGAPRERRHRFLSREEVAQTGYRFGTAALDGAFLYTDGLTDDSRLTLESILDARRYGARCLNYLEVLSIRRDGERFAVLCRDRLNGAESEISAERVINCAGPWAADFLASDANSSQPSGEGKGVVRFSAGIHLLFNRPGQGHRFFCPCPVRAATTSFGRIRAGLWWVRPSARFPLPPSIRCQQKERSRRC